MQITDFEKNAIWAISPGHLDGMMRNVSVYSQVLLSEKSAAIFMVPMDDDEKDYALRDGVAIIPINGPISKGYSFMSRYFGGSSTASIMHLVEEALDDNDVEAIVLDINSPGGTIPGIESLSAFIFESRNEKPIVSYSDGLMLSAGYWIGSAADRIVIQTTAEAGSIGVVMCHYDYSKWDEMDGLKRTYLTAGKYKAMGNNAEPLSDQARDMFQSELDHFCTVFVDAVARNLGTGPETVLKDMADGRIFIGQQAIDAGLADMIGNLDDAVELAQSLVEDNFSGTRGMASVQSTITKEEMNMGNKKMEKTDASPINSVEALEAMYPDYAKALIDRGAAGVNTDGAVETAVKSETERLIGLVSAHFGDDAGEKFKAIVETGVTVDQYKAIRGGDNPDNEPDTAAADEAAQKQKMLDAIHNAAHGGVGSGAGTAGDQDFDALIEGHMAANGCTRAAAIAHCMKAFPAAHESWLQKMQPQGTA